MNFCCSKKEKLELLDLRGEGLARDNLECINSRRVLDVCFWSVCILIYLLQIELKGNSVLHSNIKFCELGSKISGCIKYLKVPFCSGWGSLGKFEHVAKLQL